MGRPFAEEDSAPSGPDPWERGDEATFANEGLEATLLAALVREPAAYLRAGVDPAWFVHPLHADIARGLGALVASGETRIEANALFAAIGRKASDKLEGLSVEGKPVATVGEFAKLLRNKGGLAGSPDLLAVEVHALWLRRQVRQAAGYCNGGSASQGAAELWERLEVLRREGCVEPIDIVLAADAVAQLAPPDYAVDGILQRGFLYSLTGQTGHAKTAVALRIAKCVARGEELGRREVEPGKVLYFAGENPTDVAMRLAGMQAVEGELGPLYVSGRVGALDAIAQMAERRLQLLGGVELIIVDTSAAYFAGDEENSNAQSKRHASMLRRLTKLPGKPCVLVLCHPRKDAAEQGQMVPRGGGAFVAEVDGNLTVVKQDDGSVELHHTDKWRGPGFTAMQFRLETVAVDALVDSRGRRIPTVRATWVNAEIEAARAAAKKADTGAVLVAMLTLVGAVEIARHCGWFTGGDPDRKKVHRICEKRLLPARLVKRDQDGEWRLTEPGRKEAERLRDAASVTQPRAYKDD